MGRGEGRGAVRLGVSGVFFFVGDGGRGGRVESLGGVGAARLCGALLGWPSAAPIYGSSPGPSNKRFRVAFLGVD